MAVASPMLGSRSRSASGRLADVAERVARSNRITWPSPRWQADPVGFARDVLGIELWSAQVEILESIRDHRNTTVRSGHKCGKSTALAVAALWFFCSFDRARVFLTAVKPTQIDEVIWKEIRRLYRGAKIPIDGELYDLARSGLKADDERQIWGGTARDGEGLAGISGPNILVLADEASGIQDKFFEVLGSSLAGSGGTVRKCYISNPTKTKGEFYRSHTTSAALFNRIAISSENTPNARGLRVVPGLAGSDWIAEKRIEYGEDSPAYRIRVKGEFVYDRDKTVNSLNDIADSQARWDAVSDEGQLQIGVDPAGDGVKGDESAVAVRRGMKIVTLLAERGMSEAEVVHRVLDLIATHHRPREKKPRVAVDAGGGIGSRVVGLLRAHLDQRGHANDFELIELRGEKIFYGSRDYQTIRSALWGAGSEWIKAGGAVLEDHKLTQELNTPVFFDVKGKDGLERYDVTDKNKLRKDLGRSPDRADAFNLACWGWTNDAETAEHVDEEPVRRARAASPTDDDDDLAEPARRGLNPYAGIDAWEGR